MLLKEKNGSFLQDMIVEYYELMIRNIFTKKKILASIFHLCASSFLYGKVTKTINCSFVFFYHTKSILKQR